MSPFQHFPNLAEESVCLDRTHTFSEGLFNFILPKDLQTQGMIGTFMEDFGLLGCPCKLVTS